MNRPTEEPERPAAARDDLESWRESQPSNFVKESRQFNRLMDRLSDPENRRAQASSLDHFGAVVAGPLDEAAMVNNRPWNLPRLDRWSPICLLYTSDAADE